MKIKAPKIHFSKKISIFFILIFFFNCTLYYSNRYADSLIVKLNSAKNDSDKVNLNIYLCGYYQQKETQKALIYARSALVFAKKTKLKKFIAKAYQHIGLCYSFRTSTDTAAIYFDSAYVIFNDMKSYSGLSATHLYIGENLFTTASWDKALFHFLKSVENAQLMNDKNGLSKGYGKLAEVLLSLNRLDEAMMYAKKGIHICESEINLSELAKLYNTTGIVFDYQGITDSALIYYKKSLVINQKINSTYDVAISFMNVGAIYVVQSKFELAEESTLKALDLMIKLDEKGSVAACYVNLGEIYLNLGLYSKSIEFLDKGIAMLKDLKRFDFLLEGLRIKSIVLKSNKNFEQALNVYEQYTRLKDSLFSSESNRNITEMQTRFKSKEQEVEIKLHQAETIRQKSINNFIIGIIVLVGLIAVFLVLAYRDKRKANKLLHLQKHIIEEKQKEILDSIHYAKRIQTALITSENYFEKKLKQLIK